MSNSWLNVTLACVACVAGTVAAVAQAQTATPATTFGGITVAIEAARQNIIGGSLVANVDVLQQASRPVASLVFGGRGVAARRVVFGAEVAFGRADGNLELRDAAQSLSIDYRNSAQHQIGAIAGVLAGSERRTLLLAYVGEVTRTFDVAIRTSSRSFTQRDEQGLLRFGVGVERIQSRYFSVRVTLGSSRADFGDRETNIDVTKPIDFGVALVWRWNPLTL